MKKTNQVIYGLFGIGALLFGVVALFFPTMLLSETAQSFPLRHIFREEGAAAIFIGLMAFWCVFNYERRRGVHYALMVFAFLLAGIHWFDYFGGHLRWISAAYTTVPFAVLLTMTILSPSPKHA